MIYILDLIHICKLKVEIINLED